MAAAVVESDQKPSCVWTLNSNAASQGRRFHFLELVMLDRQKSARLDHAANPGRHSLADRKDDLYETPSEAVYALLEVEDLPDSIWECACGGGAIARVLRYSGFEVYATDLVDHRCPGSESRIDFLLEQRAPDGIECILTNPPYKNADQFVAHALKLVPHVIMLLPLRFLESERRTPILDSGTLARVYVFKNRLPMMHRAGWSGPRATSSIAFAWFVWDRNHVGPATINRISAPAMEAAP
jgi:hypothetical protein